MKPGRRRFRLRRDAGVSGLVLCFAASAALAGAPDLRGQIFAAPGALAAIVEASEKPAKFYMPSSADGGSYQVATNGARVCFDSRCADSRITVWLRASGEATLAIERIDVRPMGGDLWRVETVAAEFGEAPRTVSLPKVDPERLDSEVLECDATGVSNIAFQSLVVFARSGVTLSEYKNEVTIVSVDSRIRRQQHPFPKCSAKELARVHRLKPDP